MQDSNALSAVAEDNLAVRDWARRNKTVFGLIQHRTVADVRLLLSSLLDALDNVHSIDNVNHIISTHGAKISTKRLSGMQQERVKVLMDTLRKIAANKDSYTHLAARNLERWGPQKRIKSPGCHVDVVASDWGDAALQATKRFGTRFACLNMANAYHFGGGYAEGMAAQEENMFRRSDCHFADYRLEDRTQKCIKRNSRGEAVYYRDYSDMLNGKSNEAYLDMHPRVCIKRSESDNYADLSEEDVFDFYELRSAAADMRQRKTAFNKEDCLRRIQSQFEALKRHDVRHVILSAFGCGAFENPPDVVAECYYRVIRQYALDVDVVLFAVYHPGYGPDNFSVFKKQLGNTNFYGKAKPDPAICLNQKGCGMVCTGARGCQAHWRVHDHDTKDAVMQLEQSIDVFRQLCKMYKPFNGQSTEPKFCKQFVSKPKNASLITWCMHKVRAYADMTNCDYWDSTADDMESRLTDVRRLVREREPCNIAMRRYYDLKKFETVFGYKHGAYGHMASDDRLPPNILIYAPTPFRDVQGVVHVINAIAPALDSEKQPDAKYFVKQYEATTSQIKKRSRRRQTTVSEFDIKALQQAYTKLYRHVYNVAISLGFKTVIWVGKIGGSAFWSLPDSEGIDFDETIYNPIFRKIKREYEDAISTEETVYPKFDVLTDMPMQSSEKLRTSVFVNAWDPWSIVGNGNCPDRSADGAFGCNSCLSFLTWPVTNPHLDIVDVDELNIDELSVSTAAYDAWLADRVRRIKNKQPLLDGFGAAISYTEPEKPTKTKRPNTNDRQSAPKRPRRDSAQASRTADSSPSGASDWTSSDTGTIRKMLKNHVMHMEHPNVKLVRYPANLEQLRDLDEEQRERLIALTNSLAVEPGAGEIAKRAVTHLLGMIEHLPQTSAAAEPQTPAGFSSEQARRLWRWFNSVGMQQVTHFGSNEVSWEDRFGRIKAMRWNEFENDQDAIASVDQLQQQYLGFREPAQRVRRKE